MNTLKDLAMEHSLEKVNPTPVLINGEVENFIIKIDEKSFYCNCGYNVFHKPDNINLNRFKCNSCGEEYLSE